MQMRWLAQKIELRMYIYYISTKVLTLTEVKKSERLYVHPVSLKFPGRIIKIFPTMRWLLPILTGLNNCSCSEIRNKPTRIFHFPKCLWPIKKIRIF